jgi:MFS family permease
MNSFGKHMGDYTENSSKMGWLVSILELGAWLGTLYSGFLAEIFSRKYAILVNTAIFIVGVVIQSTAVTGAGHNSILAGRFITGKSSCLLTIADRKLTIAGMGVGSLSMIVPMYNAECAPPEIRGAMVGMQQMAITTGIMIAFWIDYGKFDQTRLQSAHEAYLPGVGTNYIGGSGEGQSDAAWLVPLCLQLFPAVILGIGMIFMVISPMSQIFRTLTYICTSLSRPDGSFTMAARPMPAKHSPACATCRQITI